MKKKLQVFVSSTYTDLIEERQAAVEAILSAGHIPAGMELFTAGDESQLNVIEKWIDESDIYLLILGGRYGSIEPKSGKSYIQLEYEYAVKTKKPYFSIITKESALDEKVKKLDKKVLELENPQKYKEFYSIVTSKMCSFFEDTKDIKIAIHNKMLEYAGREDLYGWVCGKDIKGSEHYAEEILRLVNENKQLKIKNDILEGKIREHGIQPKSNISKGKRIGKTLQEDNFQVRVNRVLKLIGAEEQGAYLRESFSWVRNEKEYTINEPEGNFEYYCTFLPNKRNAKGEELDDRSIDYLLVVSIDRISSNNLEGELADIRLMVEEQKKVGGNMRYKYVLASRQITDEMEAKYVECFNLILTKAGIRNKSLFSIEIWNDKNLSAIEEKLGLGMGEMLS